MEHVKKKQLPKSNCDSCEYYDYDDEYDCYCCGLNLDEDEMERFSKYENRDCPYYRFYDEYKLVQKQN